MTTTARKRCNCLDGKRWLRNSISVWSDIAKSAYEKKLKHPMSPSDPQAAPASVAPGA